MMVQQRNEILTYVTFEIVRSWAQVSTSLVLNFSAALYPTPGSAETGSLSKYSSTYSKQKYKEKLDMPKPQPKNLGKLYCKRIKRRMLSGMYWKVNNKEDDSSSIACSLL